MNQADEIETVVTFGEKIDIMICPDCHGSGNSVEWDRKLRQHIENHSYFCHRCKGAKYIVVSYWKANEH